MKIGKIKIKIEETLDRMSANIETYNVAPLRKHRRNMLLSEMIFGRFVVSWAVNKINERHTYLSLLSSKITSFSCKHSFNDRKDLIFAGSGSVEILVSISEPFDIIKRCCRIWFLHVVANDS